MRGYSPSPRERFPEKEKKKNIYVQTLNWQQCKSITYTYTV